MRRTVAWIVVGIFVAGVAPVSAGDVVTTVTPNPVRQNKKITVTALDCISGPDWEAIVVISILDKDGELVFSSHRPADDDGTTEQRIKIKKAKYPTGTYSVYVDCIHEFDDGGSGVWYETEHDLKVKKKKG